MNGPLPIRRQLVTMILVTSSAVLLLTSAAFVAYEVLTFRRTSVQQLDTLTRAIAANSSAALAFDNPEDGASVLSAFRADPHIVGASLYDRSGRLFATYPPEGREQDFPPSPEESRGYRFERTQLVGFQPIVEGSRRLGTLYVKSDLRALDARMKSYGSIVLLVICASAALAYLISERLQRHISRPILNLARAATAVSTRRDYSVRADPSGTDEINSLTDAFNDMLAEIQRSEERMHLQIKHLGLLQHVTRAIGDRLDLHSIFQAMLDSLERDLAIDFGCVLLKEVDTEEWQVHALGSASGRLAGRLGFDAGSKLAGDGSAFAGAGHELLYVPDTRASSATRMQRVAAAGLHSLVLAPLLVDSRHYGMLVVARRQWDGFTGADREFLQQLNEHVALAANQARLYGSLQRAYGELQRSQQAMLQRERLSALGEMASGIAHDINNAISPIALYTESLLEREAGLSERARRYLLTIQRAIDDVAGTVARMREFYRTREPQVALSRVDINGLVRQAIDLTEARWRHVPQQRGVDIRLCTSLSSEPAEVMAAEGEIRDVLTNLIFNAVDAMPEGGVLSLNTRVANDAAGAGVRVLVEVADTGIGMDETTRARCLEPFFTTKGERGTGLGLAMVYGAVQRHSADLQIESTPGQGSVFRLVFAAADQVLQPEARPPEGVRGAATRILLVDDDPALLASLQQVLATDGHEVTVADSGHKVTDLLLRSVQENAPFGVVITDLGMPGFDGRKVAAAVKSLAPAMPVLMLTGWGRRMLAEGDTPPGVDRVLAKPPSLRELRAALADLVGAPVDASAATGHCS